MNQDSQQANDPPTIPPDRVNDGSPLLDAAAVGVDQYVQQAAATAVPGRRVSFSLPNRRQQGSTGRRIFRIPNGSRVTIRHRANGQVHLHHHNPAPHHRTPPTMQPNRDASRMVPVEELVPVPIHEDLQVKQREPGPPRRLLDATAAMDEDGPFECVICYDTLIDPVGCGSCTSRFCRSCLHMALHQQSRCPVCRDERRTIVPDEELKRRLSDFGIICQYCSPETFDGTLFPIGVHRLPHADCPDLHVACRLAPYGCSWIGPRRNIDHNCAYEPITGLLEQFRRHEIHSEEMIRYMASTHHPPPPPLPTYTVFPHFLQFTLLLCTQPYQLRPESWLSFVDSRQNFHAALTCLPTAIIMIKLFTMSLLNLLEIIENQEKWTADQLGECGVDMYVCSIDCSIAHMSF